MRQLPAIAVPLLSSVLLLAACAPAQVRVPDALAANSVSFPVEGHSPRRWGQPLRFGPYRTAGVDDGTEFAWAVPVGRNHVGAASRPYRYTLLGPDSGPVDVQCRSEARSAWRHSEKSTLEIDLSAVAGSRLDCDLYPHQGGAFRLRLAYDGHVYRGELGSRHGHYPVRSLHRLQGSPFDSPEPVGYEFRSGGEPVMVVETLNAGRVLLAEDGDADERMLLAAAATALLLFDPGQSALGG